MNSERHLAALNQLLQVVYRSLPMYLSDAAPWQHLGDERAAETLAAIVRDHQDEAQLTADLILSRSNSVDVGGYPMGFTDRHFLSLDFLLHDLERQQQAAVAKIEQLCQELAGDAPAQALAQRILGAERAHLDQLRALAPRATVAMGSV